MSGRVSGRNLAGREQAGPDWNLVRWEALLRGTAAVRRQRKKTPRTRDHLPAGRRTALSRFSASTVPTTPLDTETAFPQPWLVPVCGALISLTNPMDPTR